MALQPSTTSQKLSTLTSAFLNRCPQMVNRWPESNWPLMPSLSSPARCTICSSPERQKKNTTSAVSLCTSENSAVQNLSMIIIQSRFFWFFFYYFIVPCGKFGSPYLGKTQQPQEQCYRFLSVRAAFSCVQTMVWLPVFGNFNVRTDWLIFAYIALFSALLSRLTALACGSTWVTGFL